MEKKQFMSCSDNKLSFKSDTRKMTFNTNKKLKNQHKNDLIQTQIDICKLEKLGKPFLSIPGKKILDSNTLNRLKNKSVVVTSEEQRELEKLEIAKKEQLKVESTARKIQLQNYNLFKTKDPKLSLIDNEANKKATYLLNRAFELKQNQEEEIKKCNTLILGTKCHVIRAAQIAEKEHRDKEMKQEQRRLEKFLEQERMLAAKKYEKAVEMERQKKKIEALHIIQQIRENEIAKEIEAAKLFKEIKLRKEACMEAERAEVNEYKENILRQENMRKEFMQINAQLKDMKQIEKELEKKEMLQIQEYERNKNERETKYEEEMKKQKLLKEKEIAKIQASQQASQDMQAARDELNALRIQDNVEQEWRRKEHEDNLKKIKVNEDLKKARQKQIEDQEQSILFRVISEKEEFDRIIRHNLENMKKQKELEKQTKIKIDEHLQELKKQVTEKEMEKIQEIKIKFQEGVKFQEGEVARNNSLRNTMRKKMEELKTHNFPPRYIQGIERQLKL